jgi:hypothetical protein
MDILTCRLPENKPLAIAPLGDIQYGNEGCSLRRTGTGTKRAACTTAQDER